MSTIKPADEFNYYAGDVYWNDFDQTIAMQCRAISGGTEHWIAHTKRIYGVRDTAFLYNCGNGWVERDCFRQGFIRNAIGCDIQQASLDTARAEADKIGIPARYFNADINTFEPDELKVDAVINLGAGHHVAYIDRLTRQLRNMLNSDGIYVVMDYTGAHRNQYDWPAWSRAMEVNAGLPQCYQTALGYAHLPTMIGTDPSEAVHSELQMDTLRRYFDVIEEAPLGGAIAYPILFQKHALHRDQHTEEGGRVVRSILEADAAFTREHPESNLFTYCVARPKTDLPNREILDAWQREEEDRENRASQNGGRYYLMTGIELLTNRIADLQYEVNVLKAAMPPRPMARGPWWRRVARG